MAQSKDWQAWLYGEQMRVESGKFLGRRTASVGALKSLLVKMLRTIMPSFTQFGSRTKKHAGRQVQPNAMLFRLASQYGHSANNVGVARSTRATGRKATPGFSPAAEAIGSIGLKDGQDGKVNSMYQSAVSRAFRDETAEMLRHIEASVLDNAEQSGFAVR